MTHSKNSKSTSHAEDRSGLRPEGLRLSGLLPKDLLHFAGVGGSGMSALAQFHVWSGGRATGSDRAFDQNRHPEIRACLEAAGVQIVPQDGRGLTPEHRALVVSTAVEDTVPDVRAARELGVEILHRSELLAHWVRTHRTLAVTGTSGKSTVVAMIFEILQAAGFDPGVITGGNLRSLQSRGLLGNAARGDAGSRRADSDAGDPGGAGDAGGAGNAGAAQDAGKAGGAGDASDIGTSLLVIEADESDGSLVRYEPAVGVVLNLQRDHKEPEVVFEMFERFRDQTRETLVVGAAENLDALIIDTAAADLDLQLERPESREPASERRVGSGDPSRTARAHPLRVTRYGLSERAEWRAVEIELSPTTSRFRVLPVDVTLTLPVPGVHNVENAVAAMAAVCSVGVDADSCVRGLADFQGVARRFQEIGTTPRGVQVIDDFAHNPAKIVASLRTARLRANRILAIFQPHGFGPTRFIREELVDALSMEMSATDQIWMPEIFYAGGTVSRDLSAADLVGDLRQRGVHAHFEAERDDIVSRVADAAGPGDLVLVMGARDPSLTGFARAILSAIHEKEQRRA